MILHLHGGGIAKTVYSRPALRWANRRLLRNVGRVVVLGRSLVAAYEGMARRDQIAVVPNCVDPSLFATDEDIVRKHREDGGQLRVVFLSHMIKSKGYLDLLWGWLLLPDDARKQVSLAFAGLFPAERDRTFFLDALGDRTGVSYLGPVQGTRKTDLLRDAHAFCLPSYYPYEGQPISILEAYASGAIVLTTDQGGIGDVFQNGRHGFMLSRRDPRSVCRQLLTLLGLDRDTRVEMGLRNAREARTLYTRKKFLDSMGTIFADVEHSGRL
jgi:glycosyltransferase involved in cell wall biosynthesis